ncbi:MAG: NAD(P)H-dependent oxidoreductase subunit E [Bacteroidales bacterium]|nr:NAD(P)H-dependent oxidoreductase subunit E [Bacteroidales bacterium]
MDTKHNITICMGSACFSRGSRNIADAVNNFFNNNLPDNVFLSGSLCTGNCEKGPVMIIDDKVYKQLDEEKVIEILNQYNFK